MPPFVTIGSVDWPTSPQPFGARLDVMVRNIHNSGDSGICFCALRKVGRSRSAYTFPLESGQTRYERPMVTGMADIAVDLVVEVGYNFNLPSEVITDSVGPYRIEPTGAEPGVPYCMVTGFTVPSKLPAGSDVNVKIQLKNTGGAAGGLDWYIDGNPADPGQTVAVAVGRSPSVLPGASVWVDVLLTFPMPAWNFNLIATNEDETSTLSRTITLGAEAKKPTTLTIDVYPTSGAPPYDVMITAELRSNGVAVGGKTIQLFKNDVYLASDVTDYTGKAEFMDTVTVQSSYYVYFAGDGEYEGCTTQAGIIDGLGGVALLILAWLILEGGK